MKQEEWFSCTDPQKMLGFLRGKVSDRKLQLFAVACCRRVWDLLADGRSKDSAELGEWFADVQFSQNELKDIHQSAVEYAEMLRAYPRTLPCTQ